MEWQRRNWDDIADIYLLSFGNAITNPTLALFENAGGGNLYGLRVDTTAFRMGLNTNGTERLSITQLGNVGIGITSPQFTLSTGNGGTIAASTLRLQNSYLENGGYGIQLAGIDNGTNGHDLRIQGRTGGGAFADLMTVKNSGSVGIGTTNPGYTLHVVGTAGLSTGTSWANASDIRLKDIDGDYEYGLGEIKRLHTVRFHYKKDNPLQLPSDHAMTGFIAQEVQELIPDAVRQRADGYLELNVDPIHWATVNAVKELAAENLLLKERVDKAEAQIQEVRAEALRMKERATNAEAETAEIKRAICSKIPDLSFCIP